jgi:hypothetical protein
MVHHGDRRHEDGPRLTRAEARALRRSAPLTHIQLTAHLNAEPAARPKAL